MRLKYEKVIHHAIVNNLFGSESMKKSCNAQGSSKYYLFVTASFSCMKKAGSKADCEYSLDRKAMRSWNATSLLCKWME